MKYFKRDGKYNWVDENNRFVGFDSDENCCEDFGWAVTNFDPFINYLEYCSLPVKDEFGSEDESVNPDEYVPGWTNPELFECCLDGFVFVDEPPRKLLFNDDGGFVVFKMIRSGYWDKFLRIWNHHNGYYAHGFESWNDEGYL